MERKREQSRELVDEWVTRITRALEETQLEQERNRLQQELAFLEHVRDEKLEEMSRDDLDQLNQRLSKQEAPEWIQRSEQRG